MLSKGTQILHRFASNWCVARSSIVLSVLSAYDVNNMHELIVNSIDDLLWLRLSQIVFPNQDLMTLNKLQKLVFNEGSKTPATDSDADSVHRLLFSRWQSQSFQ